METKILDMTCPVDGVDWGLCGHADVTDNFGTFLISEQDIPQLTTLWSQESGNLSLCAEMGDRAAWEGHRGRMSRLEAAIEELGGGKPPYWKGWGPLLAEVGFNPS